MRAWAWSLAQSNSRISVPRTVTDVTVVASVVSGALDALDTLRANQLATAILAKQAAPRFIDGHLKLRPRQSPALPELTSTGLTNSPPGIQTGERFIDQLFLLRKQLRLLGS